MLATHINSSKSTALVQTLRLLRASSRGGGSPIPSGSLPLCLGSKNMCKIGYDINKTVRLLELRPDRPIQLPTTRRPIFKIQEPYLFIAVEARAALASQVKNNNKTVLCLLSISHSYWKDLDRSPLILPL